MKYKLFVVPISILFVSFAACHTSEDMSLESALTRRMWSESDRTKASKRLQQIGIPIAAASLFSAIQNVESQIVEDLLKAGLSPNAMENDDESALYRAVSLGQTKTARLLIKAGADVNQTNSLSFTPLLVATGSADLEVMKLLLSEGAFVDKCSDDGLTPLMSAASGAATDGASFERGLPDPVREPTAFRRLQRERRRYLQAAKLLVQKGATLNAKDHIGMTALDYAERNQQEPIAKFLIRKGAKRGRQLVN